MGIGTPYQPGILGTGGPDAYGYRWIDSDTTGGPTYSWIDISGVGTEVNGLADDNVVGPFSVGFDFPYYWYTVNSFYVGSNGYIAFDDNTLEAAPFPHIPSTVKPNNVLAAFMSDLDFTVGSAHCYYWTNAALDTFIIAYHDVRFWNSPSSNNTFEIILTRADSSITFQYLAQTGGPSGGWDQGLSVGIENIAGNIGLEYNYSQTPAQNQIVPDLAVRFYPPDSTTYEVHDIAVMKQMNDISGGFFVYNDAPVDFWAVIKNTGNQSEAGFNVYCEIRNSSNQVQFRDTISVSSINAGDTDSLVFTPSWSTTTDGLYNMKVKSLLSGDMVASNDSIYTEFRVVTYPAELQYDVGYAHTGMAWNGDNSGYGAKFVPPHYPSKLNMIRFNINSFVAMPNVTIQVLDDDGTNGDPGTVVYDTVQQIYASDWYDIDVSTENIIIADGAFYIGLITDQASDPYFGMDTLFPSGRQTWEYTGSWAPYRDRETDDVLIRAVVDFGTGVQEVVMPGEIKSIQAAPNPFSRVTAITVPFYSRQLEVYDATGRNVGTLNAHDGIAYWNGCDMHGKPLHQGTYFAVTENNDIIKLILVR
jgi:hypothetical protein